MTADQLINCLFGLILICANAINCNYMDTIMQYIPDTVSQFTPYRQQNTMSPHHNGNTALDNLSIPYPEEQHTNQYSRISDPLSTTPLYNKTYRYICSMNGTVDDTLAEQFLGQHSIDRSILYIQQLQYYNAVHCLYHAKQLVESHHTNNKQRSNAIIDRLLNYLQYNGQPIDVEFAANHGVLHHRNKSIQTNYYNRLTVYQRIDPALLSQQSVPYQQHINQYSNLINQYVDSKQLYDIIISSDIYESSIDSNNNYNYHVTDYKHKVILDGRYTAVKVNGTYDSKLLNQRNNLVFVKYGVIIFAGYTALINQQTIQYIIDHTRSQDTVRQLYAPPMIDNDVSDAHDVLPITSIPNTTTVINDTTPTNNDINVPVIEELYVSQGNDFSIDKLLDDKQIHHIIYLAEQVCTYQTYQQNIDICNLYSTSQLWHWLSTRIILNGIHDNDSHDELQYIVDNYIIQLIKQHSSSTSTQQYDTSHQPSIHPTSSYHCFVSLIGNNDIIINSNNYHLTNGNLQCITGDKTYSYSRSTSSNHNYLLHFTVSPHQSGSSNSNSNSSKDEL